MRGDSIVPVVALGALVAIIFVPLIGFPEGFYPAIVAASAEILVASGYRTDRAIIWWSIVVALALVAMYFDQFPVSTVCILASAALYFAGWVSPGFRTRWFGQHIE